MKNKPKIIFPIWLKLVVIFFLLIVLNLSVFAFTAYQFIYNSQSKSVESALSLNTQASSQELEQEFKKIQGCVSAFYKADSLLVKDSSYAAKSKDLFNNLYKVNPEILFVYNKSSGLTATEIFETSHPDVDQIFQIWLEKNKSITTKSEYGANGVENISPLFHEGIICVIFPYENETNSTKEFCIAGLQAKELLQLIHHDANYEIEVLNRAGTLILSENNEEILEAKKNPVVNSSMTFFEASQDAFGNAIQVIYRTPKENVLISLIVKLSSLGAIWLIPFVIGIVITVFISLSISSSIKKIGKAAIKIDNGDYETKLKRKTKDEFGFTSFYFNKMVQDLKELDRVNQFVKKYSNNLAAKKSASGELFLEGVKRNATVLFAGLQDFENELKNPSAASALQLLNECFVPMTQSIVKTGGSVDKYIQNSIMSVWGTITTTGTPASDAWNAVRAALLMRVAIYEINMKRKQSGLDVIKMECGISSGEVYAGEIGSEIKTEYAALGETVSVSQQLQSYAKEFNCDIVITQNTYDLIRKRVLAEKITEIKVGDNSVKLYSVINAIGVKGPANLKELQAFLK